MISLADRAATTMQVKYYGSACAEIVTEDVRILCDPWLLDGAFEGTWYHYPPLRSRPEDLDQYTHLFISHIHPDHCHGPTLARLPRKCHVLIAAAGEPFLQRSIEREGFTVEALEPGRTVTLAGRTEVTVFGAFTNNPLVTDAEIPNVIDSALVVSAGGQTVFNANDNTPDDAACAMLRARFPRLDLALLPYSGASEYPSCFENLTPAARAERAEWKSRRYLDKFIANARALEPRAILPFAGQYVIGGRHADKNRCSGSPPVERALAALDAAGLRGLRVQEGDEIDVATLQVHSTLPPYAGAGREDYIAQIADRPYWFDTAGEAVAPDQLPPLLQKARARVWARQERYGWFRDYTMVIDVQSATPRSFQFNFATPALTEVAPAAAPARPFLRVRIDERLLALLLARKVHFNNIALGLHLGFFRDPDEYVPDADMLMSYFHA